jgi:hypothetical protein
MIQQVIWSQQLILWHGTKHWIMSTYTRSMLVIVRLRVAHLVKLRLKIIIILFITTFIKSYIKYWETVSEWTKVNFYTVSLEISYNQYEHFRDSEIYMKTLNSFWACFTNKHKSNCHLKKHYMTLSSVVIL